MERIRYVNVGGGRYEGFLMDLLVKRHFMLESNWREGRYVSFGNYDINGLHRIQLDEVEGTILSTHTAGMANLCLARLCGIIHEVCRDCSIKLYATPRAHMDRGAS
jgi:hypothetical protein